MSGAHHAGTGPAPAEPGRLRPPVGGTGGAVPQGRSTVGVDGRTLGLCHVPSARPERLVVLLHGAGGRADDALALLLPHAEERRLMLLAPQSAGTTWDVINPGYGPDVRRIQQALDLVLAGWSTPPALAIGGFSDGASYALSLGLGNGDIVDAILAFSPGFAAPATPTGRPGIFVSHGRADRVLPVDRCSRRLVPALRRAGYPVHYHEFDGGHVVPPPVVAEALEWLAARPAPAEDVPPPS
jgi:predicted esterase